MKRIGLAAVLAVLAGNVHANQPSAPETGLAILVTIPAAVLFFILSGAARFCRERNTGLPSPAEGLIVWLICLVLSAINEGGGLLCGVGGSLLAGWYVVSAVGSAYKRPGLLRRCFVTLVGLPLLGYIGLSATYGVVFFGPEYYMMQGRDSLYTDSLRSFHAAQAEYARNHLGAFLPVQTPADPGFPSGANWLKSVKNITDVEINYGPDNRSYEVRIRPVAFFNWPHNLISKRTSYYMDQTGVIRYEKMTGPGIGATNDSLPLTRSGR